MDRERELIAAAGRGQNYLRIVPTSSHGDVVMAGGVAFTSESGAEARSYGEAVRSLRRLKLVEASSAEGVFSLTEQGRQRAKELPPSIVDDLRQRFTGRMSSV